MAIYVDEIRTWTTRSPFHGGSCHMTASGDDAELHAFARKIGVPRSWFHPSTTEHHYDLTPAKREQALAAGAVFIAGKEQARKRIEARRAAIGGGR